MSSRTLFNMCGPKCGWVERITLPLLQRMETEKKRAEDKGEKLHPAQAKGSDSEEEETTFEGKGCPRETHHNQGHSFIVILK